MRHLLVVVTLAALSGCVTPLDRSDMHFSTPVPWSDSTQAPPGPEPERRSAQQMARSFHSSRDCEAAAAGVHANDPDFGWALLVACTSRRDFDDLDSLMSDTWSDELRTRKEGAAVLARVIAARGGDVAGDLRMCRRTKLPLFTLQAALAEPESYEGRLVLMRGSVSEGRTRAGVRAVRLKETRIMAESERVAVGRRSAETSDVDEDEAVRRKLRSSRTTQETVEVLHNVSVETGLDVVGHLKGPDPFLEPATDYVFLLRFDGTRDQFDPGAAEDDAAVGVATILSYFEPEPALFGWVGRRTP